MKIVEKIAHFVIPGESNNQKARLLHPQVLAIFAIKLMLLQAVLQVLSASGLKILGYAANIPSDKIVALTNEKRAEVGLPPLEMNDTLSQAALAKGSDMIDHDYWAHVAPDGTQPWKFFIDFGYRYRFAGENLARDFSNPSSAVEAWMASPTHRENMLSPKYKEIGVAVVEGDLAGVDTTIIVQFFGTKYFDTVPAIPVAGARPEAPSPAPVAMVSPSPTPETLVKGPTAEEEEVGPVGPRVLISPFNTTKGTSLVIVGLLLNVLMYDGLVASKKKIARIGGRTFAHLSFLGMILAIILIFRAGQVI